MSYKLNRPYTETQKFNFVVAHQGKNFQETSTAYYALEPWEKLVDDEVIDNTEEYQEQQAQERRKQFADNFIITSWGAFRKTPQGYSSAVEAVNTIFNMVNIAQGLTESLAPLLIFYEVPDFTDPEQCTEEWLIANQKTHEPCGLATFMQWYLEFQTIWAQTQYTSQNVPLSL